MYLYSSPHKQHSLRDGTVIVTGQIVVLNLAVLTNNEHSLRDVKCSNGHWSHTDPELTSPYKQHELM